MGRSVGRVVFDSQLKLALGLHAIAVPAKLDEGERRVGLSQGFVHLDCFDRGLFGFRKTVLRLMHAVDHLHVVAIGEARISCGVVGIGFDCLLEIIDALFESFRRAFVPGVASLQIKPVSL